ncbi:MAG TPA: hypothetical protein VFJ16_18385 [Longimicrobium sp.]|nr:hypothetical protein [Longimicrobium sp.]
MSTQAHPHTQARTPRDTTLDHRLNDIGWGAFLILMGTLWLLPAWLPDGTWLIATGVLLLALNAVRRAKGIPVHDLGVLLGVLALLAGLASLVNLSAPLVPAFIVVVGAWIVLKPLFVRSA